MNTWGEEKERALQLTRSIRRRKRRAALAKKLKAAKRTLGAAKNKVAATKAALKKLATGSSSSGGPSSFSSSKRGLSYNYPKLTTGFTKISSVAWTYNWDQKPLSGVSTAPEFVPML